MKDTRRRSGAGHGPASPAYARDVLIGLLAEAADTAGRGASGTGQVLAGTGRFIAGLVGPVWRSFLFAPVRGPSEALVDRGAREFERLARIGRAEQGRTKQLARHLIQIPVDEIVVAVRDDPKLAELVRAQARTLLTEMAGDHGLSEVIRVQGDAYVDHLRESPESVRELVREQSTSLRASFVNSLRQWNVRNDAALERIARRVLRHPPAAQRGALPLAGRYAGVASRATGFLIDVLILAGVTIVGAWVWASLLQTFPLHCGSWGGRPILWSICLFLGWAGIAAAAVFPSAYIVLFWAVTGQTPGMAVAGIRIVKPDGTPVGLRASALRFIGYVPSVWTVGLGFLAALVDDRRQAWHDKIARTCVIYVWEENTTTRAEARPDGARAVPARRGRPKRAAKKHVRRGGGGAHA